MMALVAASPTATVAESEPNNSVSQANLVTLGDTATGTIDPSGDFDYYALDVPAATIIALDVIAERAGSPLDATLTLIGTDSTSVLAFNDDFYGRDSHFEYTVSTAGRYFVIVESFDGSGVPGYTYSLALETVPPGPGDFTTLYTTGLGAPFGVAAGPAGELYVTDVDSFRLLRVAPTGQVTVLAAFPGEFPIGVVVDGLGDLLVSTVDTNLAAGKIVRLRGGQRSTFASNLRSGAAITVGPTGDVWVIDPVARLLRQYDPGGAQQGTVDLSSLGSLDYDVGLAFSPTGDLYASNSYDAIYKIVSGVPQLVYQTNPFLEGLAFDKDGYLYVANGFLGRVTLLDPSLHVVNDPFARSHVSGPTQLAFLRDASGGITSRLLADNVGFYLTPPYKGGIVEMNPTAMRAVGFRVGIDLLATVTVDAASQHLLGGVQLSSALQRYLDLQGNNNGQFDVGDFRAFLRTRGQLPAAAVSRMEHP